MERMREEALGPGPVRCAEGDRGLHAGPEPLQVDDGRTDSVMRSGHCFLSSAARCYIIYIIPLMYKNVNVLSRGQALCLKYSVVQYSL